MKEIVTRTRRQPRPDSDNVRAAIREIQENLAKLPALDSRTPDEIIGYDEFGVPKDEGTDVSATFVSRKKPDFGGLVGRAI